jgi:hypothetical protein
LNRIVEIGGASEHAGEQRIDVFNEIGAALGGSRGCELNNERCRAGDLTNQA